MDLTRFLAVQLGNPQGRFGRVVMTRLLNRGNEDLIAGALATLELRPNDTFLDVGFGGGVSLAKARAVVQSGRLFGVDRSVEAVQYAQRRFAAEIRQGRMEFMLGDVVALPCEASSIDALLTTNTVYFWPDLEAGLRECARVLKPGGRLAIGISGEAKMRRFHPVTRHGFRLFSGADLATKLSAMGWRDTRVIAQFGRHSMGDEVIVAKRAAGEAT